MAEKKGMNFFKSFASGGNGKSSMFSGMNVKKKQQHAQPQTETNLTLPHKLQDSTLAVTAKDDSALNKQSSHEYAPPLEQKEEEPLFKKGSKLSESGSLADKKAEQPEISPKSNPGQKNQESTLKIEQNKVEEPGELQSNRSSVFSSEEITTQTQNPNPTPKPSKKREVPEKKPSKQQKQKPQKESPFSSSLRKGSTNQPKKQKKSDRQQILDQISEFTLKLAGVVIHQKETKLQIAETKNAVEQLRNNVARWTSQQAVSAEREDYEEADRLQTDIEEAEKKTEQLEMQLGFMQEQAVKQEHEEVELLRKQNEGLKRLGRRLKLVELQLQEDASNWKREEVEKIESLKHKQESERKKLQRIERDIAYQSEQIAEFEKEFTQELEGKVSPLKESRARLEHKKADLEAQVKELTKRLQEKKGELSNTTRDLKQVGEQIKETQAQFQEESEKLQERKGKMEEVQNERDEMQLNISDIESHIEAETILMENKVKAKMAEAQELADLVRGIEQKQTFEEQVKDQRYALESLLQSTKELKSFEGQHHAQKQRIKELEYKRSTVAAEVARLRQRREELRGRLPALEAEQKKFADLKNFKAAGIKKGEVKEISEELNGLRERLDSYLGEEHGLELELEDLKAAQQETHEEEALLQRKVAAAQARFNQEKLLKLREYRTELDSSSRVPVKEKQRLLKELDAEVARLELEISHLTQNFQLQNKVNEQDGAEEPDEEEPEVEEKEQSEDQKQEEPVEYDNEEEPEKENNEEDEREYQPLVIHETEQTEEPEDNNEDSGYVPLQLE